MAEHVRKINILILVEQKLSPISENFANDYFIVDICSLGNAIFEFLFLTIYINYSYCSLSPRLYYLNLYIYIYRPHSFFNYIHPINYFPCLNFIFIECTFFYSDWKIYYRDIVMWWRGIKLIGKISISLDSDEKWFMRRLNKILGNWEKENALRVER